MVLDAALSEPAEDQAVPETEQSLTDLIGLMEARGEEFSRSEQRLRAVILADVASALRDGIVELSARANVSPPTVTRFCRRLGCRNYAEFRVQLAQSRFIGKRYLEAPTGPTTPQPIAEQIFNVIQSALHAHYQSLDFARLEEASDAICASPLILSFGSGGVSSLIAAEVENRLFRLGRPVSYSIDHQAQLMRAAAAPARTVIVAASVSGRNRPLADTLARAGKRKLKRIVFTRPGSIVADEADILLSVDLPEGEDILRPTASRYAYLATVDVLSQLVATKLGDGAVNSMRRIKRDLLLLRDEDDRQALGD